MNRLAAKEKRRSSGPARSYLQTRVRASRLYEAAFILAIIELTRRLHQAYAQAYDKQVAEWLLPQNPSPTAPAQPLPPNYKPPKDLEEPCIKRIGAVTNDLRKIAQMVHGRVSGYDFTSQKRHAFPGADINPRGQSFGQAISRLEKNGFESSTVLGIQWSHSEGAGYQKKFSDGLWYHVIVDFPTGTDSSTADPRRPTPQITAHCHATNPTGLAHFLDSIP